MTMCIATYSKQEKGLKKIYKKSLCIRLTEANPINTANSFEPVKADKSVTPTP